MKIMRLLKNLNFVPLILIVYSLSISGQNDSFRKADENQKNDNKKPYVVQPASYSRFNKIITP
ncbi:MAG: hypothetical protein ACPG5B_07670 [Chitinophagales bacterium]